MLLEISGEIPPERMKGYSQSKNNTQLWMGLVMEAKFDVVKTDKLEVVKQEMTRVNIDILGISELGWTGMDEFNSDDHYIYCCGQESLRRNGVAFIVNKRVQNAVLGCNLKNNRKISVRFHSRQTIQYHGNPSLCSDQ